MTTKTASIIVGAFLLSAGGMVLAQVVPKIEGVLQPSTLSATSTEIQTAQEQYRRNNGKYFQIKPDGKLENGISPTTLLGKEVAPGVQVNEYQRGKERGYSIRWKDSKGEYSKGYGLNAEFNTWTKLYPTVTATSTK